MNNIYAQNFAELKEVLPKNYQKKIADSSDNLSVEQVKRAFSGILQDEEILRKVLLAAQKVLTVHLKKQKKLTDRTARLVEQAKKIA